VLLLRVDHAKRSSAISDGTRGKEQLVLFPVHHTSLAEFDAPKIADDDWVAGYVGKGADQAAGLEVKCIDLSIHQVSHQDRVAGHTKLGGRQRQAPRGGQGSTGNECAHEISGGIKDVHYSGTRRVSEGDKEFSLDVFHIVRIGASGKVGVGER